MIEIIYHIDSTSPKMTTPITITISTPLKHLPRKGELIFIDDINKEFKNGIGLSITDIHHDYRNKIERVIIYAEIV